MLAAKHWGHPEGVLGLQRAMDCVWEVLGEVGDRNGGKHTSNRLTAYDKLQLTYFKETREKAFQQVTACTLPPQNAVYVCAACIPEGKEKEMRIQIPEGI